MYQYTLRDMTSCTGWDCYSPALMIILVLGVLAFFAVIGLGIYGLYWLYDNARCNIQNYIDKRIERVCCKKRKKNVT